jgi:hypothetical protein
VVDVGIIHLELEQPFAYQSMQPTTLLRATAVNIVVQARGNQWCQGAIIATLSRAAVVVVIARAGDD